MTKISQSVVEGVEARLRKIQNNPQYFSQRSILIQDELIHDADLHSFWIEHPELRGKLLEVNKVSDEEGIKRTAKQGIKNIKAGWEYLTSNRFKESQVGVLGFLTPETIKEVGKLVDPVKNSKGFRKDLEYVGSPFSEYTPRSPILVPGMIEKMCNYVRREDHLHPIELAAEAHLRIAGIQAFNEGNKRTARLIERRILEGYGLPTSFIPYGERAIYLDLTTRALKGLKAGEVYEQTPFFDYIGGKVATALDKIIDDLKV